MEHSYLIYINIEFMIIKRTKKIHRTLNKFHKIFSFFLHYTWCKDKKEITHGDLHSYLNYSGPPDTTARNQKKVRLFNLNNFMCLFFLSFSMKYRYIYLFSLIQLCVVCGIVFLKGLLTDVNLGVQVDPFFNIGEHLL